MRTAFTFIILWMALLCHSQSYQDSVRELRVKHLAELTDPENGVLTQEELKHFKGLDYFMIDTNYIVQATFVRKIGPRFKMPTSTSRTPVYRRYGFILFTLDGKEHKLTLYQNIKLKRKREFRDYLFLPFKDKTSGQESYGGGRYLDLLKPKAKEIRIDFNLCYNPYCAYSVRYSCPIPPPENTLSTPILAGEKSTNDH
ncbi:MAG: DUF1684 domain-containing protein [Bacteroidota bacterium]|jgi:uncharacterized protein (DUF1684 family)